MTQPTEQLISQPASLTEQDQADLETGRQLRQFADGNLIGAAHFACLLLIRWAVNLDARMSEYVEHGVRIDGQPEGNWKITVEEVEDEQS